MRNLEKTGADYQVCVPVHFSTDTEPTMCTGFIGWFVHCSQLGSRSQGQIRYHIIIYMNVGGTTEIKMRPLTSLTA